MPQITFDVGLTNTIQAGQTSDADALCELIFKPQAVPNNLAVVNGQITAGNLDLASFQLQNRHVRRGTFTRNRIRGGSVNLDYFDDWWPKLTAAKFQQALPTPVLDREYLPIPGLACTWYTPWEGGATTCEFFWGFSVIIDANVSVQDKDSSTEAGETEFRLFINGERTDIHARFMRGQNTLVFDSTNGTPPNNISIRPDQRHWTHGMTYDQGLSGAYDPLPVGIARPWARGWQSASIRVASPNRHVRVKNRRFGVKLYR